MSYTYVHAAAIELLLIQFYKILHGGRLLIVAGDHFDLDDFGHCEGIKRLGRQTQTDLEEQADYNELTKIDQLFGVVRFQYAFSPDKCEDDHTCDQAGEGDKKGPTSQLVPHTDDKN